MKIKIIFLLSFVMEVMAQKGKTVGGSTTINSTNVTISGSVSTTVTPRYVWLKTNGTATNATAINNFFDTTKANTVEFEAGVYVFSGVVKFPSNKKIIGTLGKTLMYGKFLNKNGRYNGTISATALDSNIIIQGITFRGNSTNDTGVPVAGENTIQIDNAKNVLFENCIFEKAENDGLVFVYSENCQVRRCTARNNRKAGFYWSGCNVGSITDSETYNNQGNWSLTQPAGMGIDIVCDNFSVNNLRAYNNNFTGFYATCCKNITVNNSNLTGNVGTGAEARGGNAITGVENMVISGCTIIGSIGLDLSKYISITNCNLTLTNTYMPFVWVRGCNWCSISNNLIRITNTLNTTDAAIYLGDYAPTGALSFRNKIANNYIIIEAGPSASKAIGLKAGAHYNEIQNNTIESLPTTNWNDVLMFDENANKNNWKNNGHRRPALSYTIVYADNLF